MEKELRIFIMPSFDSARETLGYEEYDDFDFEAVLHQQGYDGNYRNIEDDETFEIPEGYIGRLNIEEEYYLLSSGEDLDEKENYLIEDDLQEGKYRLSLKDHVIYDLDEEDEDYMTGKLVGYQEDSDHDPRVESIYNLITDSAKTRFDYDAFSDKIGDESADSLLFQIMVSLAIGESKELISARVNANIMMMGFMMENDSLLHFIEDREKDLAMEILALKIAKTNLDEQADPLAVYLQTEKFLTGS